MINIDEQTSKNLIIDLKPDNIVVEPFPHVIKQPFFNISGKHLMPMKETEYPDD